MCLLFVEIIVEYLFVVIELMMSVLFVVCVVNVVDVIVLAVKLEGGCYYMVVMYLCNIENMNQMVNVIDISIFVKNGLCIVGLGLGGEGWIIMIIIMLIGEGVISVCMFVCLCRCVLVDVFRIV